MSQYTLDLPVVTIAETGSRHVLPTDKELKVERDAAEGNVKDIQRRLETCEAKRQRLIQDGGEDAGAAKSELEQEQQALEAQLKIAKQIIERLNVAIENRATIMDDAEVVSITVKIPTYEELTKAESLFRSLENDRFVTDRAKVLQHLMRVCAPDVQKHHPAIGKYVERWLMRAVWPDEDQLPFWFIALNRC